MKRKKTNVRARLLDALQEQVILMPLPNRDVVLDVDDVAGHNEAIRPYLARAQCIEASNVARFFDDAYVGPHKGGGALWTDLKCLVPPYQSFFVEWEKPYIPTALRMGMLFIACAPDQAEATVRSIIGDNAHTTPKRIAEFRLKNPKWIYLTFDFMEFSNADRRNVSGLRGPYHVGTTSISDDGAIMDFWTSHGSVLSLEQSQQVAVAAMVGWTALAMMNCQNIDTVEHRVPEPFQRSRQRKGKRELISYRTIQVNMEKTPRGISAERLPDVDAEGKRLHAKRGHMKDYRHGKGLFGKLKGLWYWGPQLAGSADEGVVISDYEVRP